ncbi:hypothetical protein LEP1GSC058_0258 [Leptospira fainei serovar Hurstbridge str. BUT 6]|uniref:Uncharacterized protein n=1 Tax=Leptospira fainei serovar Hurstbridge str. BUT 6 TaxID=1193011 RepID=S3UPY8_9LEPT|nr:hypothetical protein LEP1GSC058_0258 [Leptospira fainei serovar Hurstbridge str. BUT 6]
MLEEYFERRSSSSLHCNRSRTPNLIREDFGSSVYRKENQEPINYISIINRLVLFIILLSEIGFMFRKISRFLFRLEKFSVAYYEVHLR